MKWPENNHSPVNRKAYLAIPAMLCQEPCYRQYTAETIRKRGDFNEKRALVVALPGMRLIPKASFWCNHLRALKFLSFSAGGIPDTWWSEG